MRFVSNFVLNFYCANRLLILVSVFIHLPSVGSFVFFLSSCEFVFFCMATCLNNCFYVVFSVK